MAVRNSRTADRVRKIGTATLSDALGKCGAMDHGMQCRSEVSLMAGPAFTVRVHTADILMISSALSQCPPEYILVIDGRGERDTAIWGDLTTLAAHLKGVAGVVIDGALRDVRNIRKSRLPVFARAVVPNGGGAEYLGEVGVPVQCGGQVVRPEDWLAGDDDGVVVIPAEKLEDALGTADQIVAAEKRIEKAIRAGHDIAELLRLQDVIERKQGEVFVPQLRAATRGRGK
jgi:regulator of RNase E activity RraA